MTLDLTLIENLAPSNDREEQLRIVGKFIAELQQSILQFLKPELESSAEVVAAVMAYDAFMADEDFTAATDMLVAVMGTSSKYQQKFKALYQALYQNYLEQYYPQLTEEDQSKYVDIFDNQLTSKQLLNIAQNSQNIPEQALQSLFTALSSTADQ
jgi:hypothetical protein